MVRFLFAATAAFLMFRRAARRCFVFAMKFPRHKKGCSKGRASYHGVRRIMLVGTGQKKQEVRSLLGPYNSEGRIALSPVYKVSYKVVARKSQQDTPKRAPRSRYRKSASRAAEHTARNDVPVTLTHPDKELDAESKLTKRQLAEYYSAVAKNMLPHVADRPLSIVRCPAGTTKPCFFQKHLTTGVPSGVGGIKVRNKNGSTDTYLTISADEGLIGLAQMGVLELHPWGSRNEALEMPDRLIFDLDPDPSISWKVLAESALEFRDRLKKFGLKSFLKATGGKGLHVVAPIKAEHPWPVVKEFARALAVEMASEKPALYITKMTKAERRGRIFLDYLRNERGATSIAPYSPRARQGAPVAMPLEWDELTGKDAPRFTVAEFSRWKRRLFRDPWREMLTITQSVTKVALQQAGLQTKLAG